MGLSRLHVGSFQGILPEEPYMKPTKANGNLHWKVLVTEKFT